MAKPNYKFKKQQKELARKARQQQKLDRRKPKPDAPADGSTDGPADAPADAVATTESSGPTP